MKKTIFKWTATALCAASLCATALLSGCSGSTGSQPAGTSQAEGKVAAETKEKAGETKEKASETNVQAAGTKVAEGAKTQETPEINYPKSSLTMVIPVAAGGNMDVIGRIAARYLEKEIGKPVVVENIKGAGGAVAATTYLAEEAGTEKIIYLPSSIFTVTPLYSETEYKLEDFEPVIGFNQAVSGVFSSSSSDIKTFEDLKNFDKNKTLLFGSGGIGVANYLFQCAVYDDLGLKYDTVPHSSGSEGLVNVMAGTTNVVLSSMAAAKQYVEDGSLIPLFVYSDEPYTYANGVTAPPLSEFGINAPYDTAQFFAIRSGTDEKIVSYLENAFKNVYADQGFLDEYTAAGGELIPYSGAEMEEMIGELQGTAKEIYDRINN